MLLWLFLFFVGIVGWWIGLEGLDFIFGFEVG